MNKTSDFRFMRALFACVLLISPLQASFEPLPVGGRAAGMAEAYTAIADDVYSLYYNPAGVLQLERPELGAYYSQLFVGLTDNSEISRTFFGYGQPLGKDGLHGALGVSYLALDLPGLYKEEAIGLSYGREYKRKWNFGTTLKLLRKDIGTDDFSNNAINPITGSATGSADPLLAAGRSANALGIDLGAQYRMTRFYAAGVAIRNMNSPDVSLSGESDRAPSIFSASLARRLRQGTLGLEVTSWKTAQSNLRLSLGGEHWFKNGFGLRAGGGFGSRNYSALSFGASYQMQSIQFDYATVFPLQGVKDTIGTQQISLTVRLGKPPVDPLEQQLIKEKEQRIRAETEARYAKAERDRLKKQLLELTQTQTAREKQIEQDAAERALKEAQQQAEEATQSSSPEPAVDQVRQEAFQDYTQALSRFNDRVRQGIGLQEKRTILEKIKSDFNNSGVDLSTVDRELKSIRVAQTRAKKDFDLSMKFYRRLVEQGANNDERKNMLGRIIQKYRNTGIDISSAQAEMNNLE